MSEYTPTSAEILQHFVRSATNSTNSVAAMDEHEEMFDRWLQEVKRDAWQDGAYWVADLLDNYEASIEADYANPHNKGENE